VAFDDMFDRISVKLPMAGDLSTAYAKPRMMDGNSVHYQGIGKLADALLSIEGPRSRWPDRSLP
jgi:gamma-glutamyl-gamma-aminobutyrate hydrolase PuuD